MAATGTFRIDVAFMQPLSAFEGSTGESNTTRHILAYSLTALDGHKARERV